MNKIGLISDAVNFPSLPLMKISAYHKLKGDDVKLAFAETGEIEVQND